MPLSEHEQRLLDEIEQALYAEDPKFASSVRSARARRRVRSSMLLCVLGVLAGLGLVLVGLLANDRRPQRGRFRAARRSRRLRRPVAAAPHAPSRTPRRRRRAARGAAAEQPAHADGRPHAPPLRRELTT